MTNPTPLSPAAQAVLDAWYSALYPEVTCLTRDPEREALAAVLRAAADQVVPPDPCGDDCCIDLSIGIRADLLAIAAELEGRDD